VEHSPSRLWTVDHQLASQSAVTTCSCCIATKQLPTPVHICAITRLHLFNILVQHHIHFSFVVHTAATLPPLSVEAYYSLHKQPHTKASRAIAVITVAHVWAASRAALLLVGSCHRCLGSLSFIVSSTRSSQQGNRMDSWVSISNTKHSKLQQGQRG